MHTEKKLRLPQQNNTVNFRPWEQWYSDGNRINEHILTDIFNVIAI